MIPAPFVIATRFHVSLDQVNLRIETTRSYGYIFDFKNADSLRKKDRKNPKAREITNKQLNSTVYDQENNSYWSKRC